MVFEPGHYGIVLEFVPRGCLEEFVQKYQVLFGPYAALCVHSSQHRPIMDVERHTVLPSDLFVYVDPYSAIFATSVFSSDDVVG